ncbi:DEAD/DEAH box helicase family protein [Streptomyces sp. NPDC059991]|uniref:DEAD/DEAH box helicase family protein n=1 Tax=Streptomyces sp. NPDC059991 TaxID=3347028 RepID=UPI00369D2F5C
MGGSPDAVMLREEAERVQMLMPHQVTGCEAVVRALEAPAGGAAGELRAQVRMACGTGKTRLAAEVANRVAAGGRMLVVEPTLELVKQNLLAFRRDGGRRGAMAVVCSLSAGDPVLSSCGVPSTTSPSQLAWWWRQLERQGHRTWTVFTTYASIPALADAHALAVPGIPALPVWDLLITDEAHRSAGTTSWSLVNEQAAVPARRRLALTATPRIWSTLPRRAVGDAGPGWLTDTEDTGKEHAQHGGDEDVHGEGSTSKSTGGVQREAGDVWLRVPVEGGEQPLASMDNPAWFGPVAFELTLQQAQAAGLVARFQIVVAEIDDPVLQDVVAVEGRASEQARGLYLAAQQTALLKAARQYGLRRVLAYANRVEDAEAFATTLTAQAERLRAADVAVPGRVWGAALSAKDTPEQRHAVLRQQLAQGQGPDRKTADLSVVASVRLLGEGVDVPAVDSIAFIDPRQGAIDLVQCVGRALRIPAEQRTRAQQAGHSDGPGQTAEPAGKVATIVVPVVHLTPGSRTDLYGPAWDGVVALLRALRAHSETLIDQLATPRTPHQPRGAEETDGDSSGADGGRGADAAPEETSGIGVGGILRFLQAERDPAELAQWVQVRVREGLADDSARALEAARRYHAREGHLKVPRDHREGDILLGVHVETWRKTYRTGQLAPGVAEQLEQWGIEWAPRADAWEADWQAITTYATRRRHLLPRRDETIVIDGTVRDIGRIMTDCRRDAFTRRWPHRVRKLDGLRVNGRPVPWRVKGPWNAAWQRRLELIDLYLNDGGAVDDLLTGTRRYGSEDLGTWITGQLNRWHTLRPEQQQALAQRGIGIGTATETRHGSGDAAKTGRGAVRAAPGPARSADEPAGAGVGAVAVRRRSRSERFQLLVAAARQHLHEVGPLTDQHGRHVVHPDYVAVIDGAAVKLRARLHTTRQRQAGLTQEQLQQLAGLRLEWAATELGRRLAG